MMFNFGKKKNRYEVGKMLFDYYDGQAGLPMEPGYDEITLVATENPDKLRMEVYSRPTGDGEKVSKTVYLVPANALDDVMRCVKKHKLVDWNKHDYIGMCGCITVCKFISKGELIRVSSDNMPVNGAIAFSDIRATLFGYVDPALKIENTTEVGCNGNDKKAELTEPTATLKVCHTLHNTMTIAREGYPTEPEPKPEPEVITVQEGGEFFGFTVTEVCEDYVRFNSDLCRYIVNNGPIEKEFTVHKGERITLNMVDICDATDITVVELLDVTDS